MAQLGRILASSQHSFDSQNAPSVERLLLHPSVSSTSQEFAEPPLVATPSVAPAVVPQLPRVEEDIRSSTGDDKENGELSIPLDHNTAAHKLLRWPSIQNILYPRECDEDYVMNLEKNRGLIRAFGIGEDSCRTDEQDLLSTNFPVNGANEHSPSSFHSIAGITEAGVLTTDAETVHRYHLSYLEHMHRLHPFLNQRVLQGDVESFVRKYCPTGKGGPSSDSGMRGAKRKLAGDLVRNESSPPQVGKSLDCAVVLLVMALGAICEWRHEPIPGPVGKYSSSLDSAEEAEKVFLNSSSTSTSFATISSPDPNERRAYSFPMTNGGGGRSASAPSPPIPKNRDVIPGLAYYAYAAEILGNMHGGMNLVHVQAPLLAGLYAGQLAHPFQSHAWISRAAWACQVLIRPKEYSVMRDGPEKDLHEFAFWTCLQLESDILAELDLPASGISRSENRIDLPKGRFTLSLPNEVRAPSTMMMILYSAQIHLRKMLNRVHTDLYKSDKQNEQNNNFSTRVSEALMTNLETWRSNLPEAMKWNDKDPPADDINVARLRAKFYGASYIIHRPLLYKALHMPEFNTRNSLQRLSTGSELFGTPIRDLPLEVRRACRKCVEAAVASTVSFDGVRGRPVVTNIFGTAHA